MNPPKLEVGLGIEVYVTKTPGIGGKIRLIPEDFKVEEILTDGSEARLQLETAGAPKISEWGRYLFCILKKNNKDNLIAVRRIAQSLRISPDRVRMAGIKDARALTAQHITVAAVAPEKVSKIDLGDITIKPIRFVDEELKAHFLYGNRFQIIIRAIDLDKATAVKRIENMRGELEELRGIPNFFGHQRFGTVRPITHRVGYYIIKKDFERAAMTFLSQKSIFEPPSTKEARQLLSETRDFKTALERFPRRLLYERLMLRHLAKFPKDFLGALHRLPTKLQKLFVHACQSYLFNRFLSERIRREIPLNEPQLGDYVIDLDELGLPKKESHKATEENAAKIKQKIERGKVGIAIPLTGLKQSTSGGVQGRIEEKILTEEKVRPEDFHIPQMPKTSSQGSLRSVLTPMIGLEVRDPSEDQLNPNRIMIELGFTLRRGS
ncbi:MAG: tRNA pseudouridine(13) synthase TruD, partial [Candidatus Bathyarchaeota archaeon]|nr:tRNA pseudouridine(13) synthase TruD [Candidatus Bathyarchaeota archaeon]